MTAIPFLGYRNDADVVAVRGRTRLQVVDFKRDVAVLVRRLPEHEYVVNLCTDRYRFALGLAAAMVKRQISLLPPTHTPEMLRALSTRYGSLYALTDTRDETLLATVAVHDGAATSTGPQTELAFAPDQVAVIAFTSGSTGEPAPHEKTWGHLSAGALGEAQRFGLNARHAVTLVGTVPAQHMYGFESSVLMATCNGLAMHAGRPFYPADIRTALEEAHGDGVLITSPVHLRALLAEERKLPRLRLMVCATAPLDVAMGAEAEARYNAPLHEVYGFTEAGMVATRRPTEGPLWHALPDVQLYEQDGAVWVHGGHIPRAVSATDVLELRDSRSFILHGRSADMVNIAGKRTSLAYLNHHLNGITGIVDGVFFLPNEEGARAKRLTAFVVAPGRSREEIVHALRQRIDPAFLPRPLYLVDALPRNATGKLPREALIALAEQCARRGRDK